MRYGLRYERWQKEEKRRLSDLILSGFLSCPLSDYMAVATELRVTSLDALRRIAGGGMYRATALARGMEL
jgi:hypothetical protein